MEVEQLWSERIMKLEEWQR